jgi:two-component system cell cycle response regulator
MLDECRLRAATAQALGLCDGRDAAPAVAGAHALVVDDWDLGAEVVRDALSRDGIVTGRATSEAEALAMTAAIPFDLIAISLSLSAEDPLRLASRLRAGDATHQTPLLLIAEPAQKDRLLRGFDLGADDWLLRPVDGNELRARARNQIRRKFYQDRLRADFGSALEMALTDPLTGFYNRRYLLRHLGGLLASSQANLAVMMIDVDHFKAINDRYGHAVGDAALQAVAETLRRRMRAFDSISRYGGEEFVVVMPGAGAADAMAAAERLRAAIEAMRFAPVPGAAHRLTISVGVALATGGADSPELLLRAADLAMYRAKQAGRNRVEMARALAA